MGKLTLLELLKLRFPSASERELFAAVLRGEVAADGRTLLKPGAPVDAESDLTLKQPRRFASRGGEKLAHALAAWHYDVRGKVFLDAGCSTGGFTDCLLKNGASRVYSVDVGLNLLDWRLRSDERVTVMERTNVMSLSRASFSPCPDQAVADLSFRSLRGAAAHILGLTSEGRGIFLVKPQFEWDDPPADFHGVVTGRARLLAILQELFSRLQGEGVFPMKGTLSPIRGRKGNRELLFLLSTSEGVEQEALRWMLDELVLE
jgi:23S rRNA (cytidine1920-2'-O)/16S rRNA (cytidine1409-2'-O)-methyltransferase